MRQITQNEMMMVSAASAETPGWDDFDREFYPMAGWVAGAVLGPVLAGVIAFSTLGEYLFSPFRWAFMGIYSSFNYVADSVDNAVKNVIEKADQSA